MKPWVEKEETNHRIVVEQKYCTTIKDMKGLISDLNTLFSEHNDWKGTQAYLDSDTMEICHFCKQEYKEDFDEKGNPVCASCRSGSKEMMFEKMEEAKKDV